MFNLSLAVSFFLLHILVTQTISKFSPGYWKVKLSSIINCDTSDFKAKKIVTILTIDRSTAL